MRKLQTSPPQMTFRLLLISLPFLLLDLLHHSIALPQHRFHPSLAAEKLLSQPNSDIPPTTYFEVTKPIQVPNTRPYSLLILRHNFAYTYGKPPVTVPYSPPPYFQSKKFSTIILEWSATCEGRQYDRIFGVWLGGAELLRSCTAEPRSTGIIWKVEKDITRYYSLLLENNTLAVYLGNLVDSTYTGVYHVNITLHFYPAPRMNHHSADPAKSRSVNSNFADLIMPISRTGPLNDGLWFEIENSTDAQGKEFRIPRNAYRAVLEVYVSFHESDEFWYSNLPNDYIAANNLSSSSGNGAFREVLIKLDEVIVGAIWPFTVIFTGGINPLLWRPITAIGSFDLPTYNIEITPFLPKLLDRKTHSIQFSVTNALNVWYVDANLHVWLDKKSRATFGELLSSEAKPLRLSVNSDFRGLKGTFITDATRSVSSTGWVYSSRGNITTSFRQDFGFLNHMVMGNNANLQIVNQEIDFNTYVSSTLFPSSLPAHKVESYKRFLLSLSTNEVDTGDDNYSLWTGVALGYNENKVSSPDPGSASSNYVLRNSLQGQGVMVVKNNLVVRGLGSTLQFYSHNEANELCYSRKVSSSNYTILFDETKEACGDQSMGYSLGRAVSKL